MEISEIKKETEKTAKNSERKKEIAKTTKNSGTKKEIKKTTKDSGIKKSDKNKQTDREITENADKNRSDRKREKHATIPIFVPHLACPNQCVFCNQEKISGTKTPAGKHLEIFRKRRKRSSRKVFLCRYRVFPGAVLPE